MVFPSAPLYLDPHNWHHHQSQTQLHEHQPLQLQQNQQLNVVTHGSGGGENTHQHQIAIHIPPSAQTSHAVGGGSPSSVRPGSMADRARQAKIPQPDPGLKCPRCESTNTKFCYFNNYSLTQPRHFCKMCRRYWTRGGVLRNVPVGGGCRRNKRSVKGGGASKSAGGGEGQTIETGPSNNNSTSPISSNSNNTEMNNNNHGGMLDTSLPGQSFGTRLTQFPLLTSLQGLTHGQYGSPASNLGINFGEMMRTAAQGELGFQTGATGGNSSDLWRPHHFPNFLAGFDPQQVPHPPPSNLYQFTIDHQSMDQATNNPVPSRSSIISAMNQQSFRPSMLSINSNDHKDKEPGAVKPEGERQRGMNLIGSLVSSKD